MSKQDHQTLAEFFDEVKEAEITQDMIKAHFKAFNPASIRALFDQISNGNSTITPSLLSGFLHPRLHLSDNNLYTVFAKFDYDLEGAVSFSNFGKELAVRGKAKRDKQGGSKNAEEGFLELVRQYLDSERVLEVCRKQLKGVQYQLFDHIATGQKGYISLKELNRFMSSNGFKETREELEFLLHGLKRRSYFKVNLEAFCESLNPLEFGFYSEYGQAMEKQQLEVSKKKSEEEQKNIRNMKEHEQKVETEARKKRRRQEAEIYKQKEIQEALKKSSENARTQSERLIRKAELEAEKLQRLDGEQQALFLRDELQQINQQRRKVDSLRILNDRETNEAYRLDRRIKNNDEDLEINKLLLRDEQYRLYQDQVRNDIERENITVGLRRDRCLSDMYAFDREAEVERIRRETALALAERGLVHSTYESSQPHIYRPNYNYHQQLRTERAHSGWQPTRPIEEVVERRSQRMAPMSSSGFTAGSSKKATVQREPRTPARIQWMDESPLPLDSRKKVDPVLRSTAAKQYQS